MAAAYPSACVWHTHRGVNSGPVATDIIGVKKFAYDIWGDTVNTAARMEQHSETDRINISATTYALVQDIFLLHLPRRYRGKAQG